MKKSFFSKAAMLLAALIFLLPACSTDRIGMAEPFGSLGTAEFDSLLADSAGKPLVLCFWTTWCPACREELPELEKLGANFGDKIEVAAVSLDRKKEDLEKFFADRTPRIPVYMGKNALAAKFQVSAIPHLVIFDKKGEVVFSQAGLYPHKMLTGMLNKVLEQ